jgi:hypothetical protein
MRVMLHGKNSNASSARLNRTTTQNHNPEPRETARPCWLVSCDAGAVDVSLAYVCYLDLPKFNRHWNDNDMRSSQTMAHLGLRNSISVREGIRSTKSTIRTAIGQRLQPE